MRPPEFTGGNPASVTGTTVVVRASMRPPEFTGGNGDTLTKLAALARLQ